MSNQVVNNETAHFQFNASFLETFNTLIRLYDESIDKLNDVVNGNINSEYGVCNSCYKMRFITPNDISTYISHLTKALKIRAISSNVNDIEMFSVESARRYICQNECVPFESYSGKHVYINPKNQTLKDLVLICENDTYDTLIYSRYEMNERLKSAKEHVKLMNDMHFTATMKKLVSAIPGIVDKIESYLLNNPSLNKAVTTAIESFILFAITINSITVKSMIEYCVPVSSYNYKPKDIDNIGLNKSPDISDIVTECCLLKTNELTVRNKIPFNCNMRDIVLQDMTPYFKDTTAAIHFIMTDPRSPISFLVSKYCSNANTVTGLSDDGMIIMKLFAGCVKDQYDDLRAQCYHKDGSYTNYPCAVHDIHSSDVNWLDNIAYGNNYLDGNYRRDAVGNNKSNSITTTLDAVYKMYCGCELKTNEDISNNLVKVSNVMLSIIKIYNGGQVDNWYLVKDILTVLGEIFTRDMLKLYHNNTRVIAYDDQMEDTMIPGFLYAEQAVFVMEADEQKPTVSVDGQNQGAVGKVKKKATEIVRMFIDWITKQLSTFAQKFNQDHEKEIAWIKKNDALNKQIKEALTKKTFDPTVTNFPMYDIPAQELANVKVKEVVDKWLADKDTPIDEKAIKKELYPVGVSQQIANMKTPQEELNALTNYILYKSITPKPGYTGKLSNKVELWDDLLKDLMETGKLIESETRKISDNLKAACQTLQNQIRQDESQTTQQNQNNQNQEQSKGRASQLLQVVQNISRTYYVTMLNVLRSKFYRTSYNLYRDLVKAYQQQTATNASNGENSGQNPQTNQIQQQGQNDEGALKADNQNNQNPQGIQ